MLRLPIFLVLFAPFCHAATGLSPFSPVAVECVDRFCETGLVTFVSPNQNFAFERTDGRLFFLLAENTFDLHGGDLIEACGKTIRHDNGATYRHVYQCRHLGHRDLPSPPTIQLADLKKREFVNHNVKTEGNLISLRRDEIDPNCLQLILKDGESFLNAALASQPNDTNNLACLLGARLMLTGMMMHPAGARQILTPYLDIIPDSLRIVQPPPADLFDVPELNADATLTPEDVRKLGIRRFEGLVLATWGGDQMMLLGKHFNRVRVSLVRPDELPQAGDRVVAIGSPDTDLYSVNLAFARCRIVERASPSATNAVPVETALRSLLTNNRGNRRIDGYCHGRLLRIAGTVLDIQPSLQLFSLHADGFTIPVDCSSSPSVLKDLKAGATVKTVVLAVVESDTWHENIVLPQTRNIKLVLRSADDLTLLARPPFWTPLRLFAVIIALVIILVLIILVGRLVNRLATRRKVAERTRLAVELHDSLSQTLAGVTCQIAAGRDAVTDDPPTATALLEAAERMLESSRTELKNCLFDLRNNTVDDPDFRRAIERTLVVFREETDIMIRFPVDRALLSDSLAHAVLCIIRELVANAVRHGKAPHVRVAGAIDERQLSFSVTDDGSGFDPQDRPGPREGHFGLTGIQERLSALNGTFTIESNHGHTRISASLPL